MSTSLKTQLAIQTVPSNPYFARCILRICFVRSPDQQILITDRNNIRKLLSFVNPSLSSNGLESFTIGIEVTQNTAIFSREETKTHEFIGLHEFKGFGHEFEKAYTKKSSQWRYWTSQNYCVPLRRI